MGLNPQAKGATAPPPGGQAGSIRGGDLFRIADTTPPPISAEDLALAAALLRLAHHFRLGDRSRGALFDSPTWGDVARCTDETRHLGRRRDFPDVWCRAQEARGFDVDEIRRALAEAWPLVEGSPEEPGSAAAEAEGGPLPFRLKILGAAEFAGTEFRMNWIIRRILVEGQPCVVAAPKKGMKTTTMIDLGVSLATGTPFLGEFAVTDALPVLFLSGESGGFVLKDTVSRVCRARGIDDWAGATEGRFFIGFDLPQLSSPEQVAALSEAVRERGIRVVMIDPLYLCLMGAAADGRRVDPANLFDMGPMFQHVARACLDAGATPILVHHFRKLPGPDASAMPELENMAYAGIQEFARQWILLGRREKFEAGSGVHRLWLTVGGSAGHSGEWGVDVDEGTMADDFSGRRWDVAVRPAAEVIAEQAEDKAKKAEQRLNATRVVKDAAVARKARGDSDVALDWLKVHTRATKSGWREGLGWNSARIGPAIALLLDRGSVMQARIRVGNAGGGREVDGYVPAPTIAAAVELEGWS